MRHFARAYLRNAGSLLENRQVNEHGEGQEDLQAKKGRVGSSSLLQPSVNPSMRAREAPYWPRITLIHYQ